MRFSVEKTMAAVYFTTTSWEPYTAQKGKSYSCNIFLCAKDIVYARFEDGRTFLRGFMSVFQIFVPYESCMVNIPVAIFYLTED